MGVDADLRAERLGEDEDVSDDGRVGDDELVGLADGGGDAADGAPVEGSIVKFPRFRNRLESYFWETCSKLSGRSDQ